MHFDKIILIFNTIKNQITLVFFFKGIILTIFTFSVVTKLINWFGNLWLAYTFITLKKKCSNNVVFLMTFRFF